MNSVWAVLISLLGVLLYLWFRFEWQYGIGAIASLIHDVSATIGIYALSGIEFNLTSVAAVLTIVGYSLNDTVVIYDRVRENLRRYKAMPLEQLLDRSINETLARTLMTSLTTLVALLPLVALRRRGDPRLHDHHDLGRGHRHLLDDLHRHAGALLSQPAHRRREGRSRRRSSRRAERPGHGEQHPADRAGPAGRPGLPAGRVHHLGGRGMPARSWSSPTVCCPGRSTAPDELDAGPARSRCGRPCRRPTSWWSGRVPDFVLLPAALRQAIRAWGPVVEAMATPAGVPHLQRAAGRGAPGRRGADRAAGRLSALEDAADAAAQAGDELRLGLPASRG